MPRLTAATLSDAGSNDEHDDDDDEEEEAKDDTHVVVADSSRTRVISRHDWGRIDSDDERTLRPDELAMLSSGLSSTG